MENLGIKLKEIRKAKRMTRKEVAQRLREKGFDISDKTLYGYENGRTTANADLFMAMCEIYEVKDVLTMFGYKGYRADGNIILNATEIEIVQTYRELDEEGKSRTIEFINRELQIKRMKAYVEIAERIMHSKKEGEDYEGKHNEEEK